MPRFFVTDRDYISDTKITITGNDVKHIKNVLRLKIGDDLVICDGNGNDYNVSIEHIGNDNIITKINFGFKNLSELEIDVILYQAIPKLDKMDMIIQKSVELGVNTIIPVCTERCVVQLKSENDKLKKLNRWQKIALEASKQSGRGIIPKVIKPVNYCEALTMLNKNDKKFILYEKEYEMNIKDYFISEKLGNLEEKSNIAFMVGSEGGFSESEINEAKGLKIETIRLGKRILRTETVALAVISIIMYEIGDV